MGILVSHFSHVNVGENYKSYKNYYEQIQCCKRKKNGLMTLLVLLYYILLVIVTYKTIFFLSSVGIIVSICNQKLHCNMI